MYLLIQIPPTDCQQFKRYLHPTMYLLIPCQIWRIFTLDRDLHPTMYLLIPDLVNYPGHPD